jgi:hypothetical protein
MEGWQRSCRGGKGHCRRYIGRQCVRHLTPLQGDLQKQSTTPALTRHPSIEGNFSNSPIAADKPSKKIVKRQKLLIPHSVAVKNSLRWLGCLCSEIPLYGVPRPWRRGGKGRCRRHIGRQCVRRSTLLKGDLRIPSTTPALTRHPSAEGNFSNSPIAAGKPLRKIIKR